MDKFKYEELTTSDGAMYLPNIWNLLFKPVTEATFFVEPWHDGVPGDCAVFRLSPTEKDMSEIYFYVSDNEVLNFLRTSREVYLYGAYNQITVCQMRAKGSISHEKKNSEAEKIYECIRAHILKKAKNQAVNKLLQEEVTKRLKILNKGQLFCFHPSSYAYAVYERG